MTVNTNAVIVSVSAITYPATPQVVFGSPRVITAANDSSTATVWLSFDGIQDACRLKPAAGWADTGIIFDDFYEKIWVRLDSGSAGDTAEVQVVGEELLQGGGQH